ncbi:MAG TPA: cyclic nucleotide-binding domain-containing protein [Casimicrobiaceae bacterium]|nr:cyclic nucleotide-binding domain-containing protein [Casimicrobiaceae bacterium]
MTDNDRQVALRQSKLAAELSEEQCRVLSNLIALRDLKDGEILVAEGQSDNHLYAIVKGALCVVKNAGTADEVTLVTMSAGDFADELGFMDGAKHYASLMARGDTRVLGIEREKLESLLPTHPDIVYKVMRAIIRAVHQIQKQLSMQSTELSSYIYKMHGRY